MVAGSDERCPVARSKFRLHRSCSTSSRSISRARFQPSRAARENFGAKNKPYAQSSARTHPLHHHPDRVRSNRSHGKFAGRLSFTKKDRRTRIAGTSRGRYSYHRFDVERMRASPARSRRAFGLRRHRGARIKSWLFSKNPQLVEAEEENVARTFRKGSFKNVPAAAKSFTKSK